MCPSQIKSSLYQLPTALMKEWRSAIVACLRPHIEENNAFMLRYIFLN